MSQRPNVLYIMADQFNANCLGIAGSQVKTPHLDQLAREGVRFDQAYCNFPVCGPSRASFITGQYPRTHGMLSNEILYLDPEHYHTMPITFRKTGYQTSVVGKSHMIKKWDEEGFEHIRYSDLTDGDWRDPLQNHYFKYLNDKGLADLYDLNDVPDKTGFESRIPEAHSLETWTGDRAIEFLQSRDEQMPFFMHLSFQRPHNPLSVPFDRGLLYDPVEIELPESAKDLFENQFASKPKHMRERLNKDHGPAYIPKDQTDLKRQMAYYYSLITLIDEQIGRVIEQLKQTGQYDNTVILFVSDHGDFAGEHGMMLKSMGMNESLHKIPFILKYPGVQSPQEINELIESVDVFPTLCDLADVTVPETVEGKSVVPIIEDGKPGKEYVVCEKGGTRQMGIRTRDYRMVYNGRNEEGELYDLREDPCEINNLYGDPSYKTTRTELLEIMFDYVKHYRTVLTNAEQKNPSYPYRNGMTRLIHKYQVNWSEIKHLYRE